MEDCEWEMLGLELSLLSIFDHIKAIMITTPTAIVNSPTVRPWLL